MYLRHTFVFKKKGKYAEPLTPKLNAKMHHKFNEFAMQLIEAVCNV